LREVQSLIEPATGSVNHKHEWTSAGFAEFQIAEPALDDPAAASGACAGATDVCGKSAPADAKPNGGTQTCNTKEK
jgi:hypothetical protein